MRIPNRSFRLLLSVALLATAATAGIVEDVRTEIAANNFAAGDRLIAAYQAQRGATAELAAAISWLGRGSLANGALDRADQYASQAQRMALDLMKTRPVDSPQDPDGFLATALGASIEVQALGMDRRKETSRAVAFLQTELAKYRKTSIAERLGKNINLLSLEGKRAPALEANEWIGTKPPALSSLTGKPVLLFFWAHWCSDCKAQMPIIARLIRRYQPRGLQLVGPTRYYGYVAAGEDAAPAEEKAYIEQVRDRYYAPLRDFMMVPLSNENFTVYGCSSTPTLAIVDKNGVVSWYNPGNATEAELIAQIEKVL